MRPFGSHGSLLALLMAAGAAGQTCDQYDHEWGKHPAQRNTGLFISGGMQDGHNTFGRYIRAGTGGTPDYDKCCDICTSQSHDGVNYPLFSDVSRTTAANCASFAIRSYDKDQMNAVDHLSESELINAWFCTFHTETTLTTFASGGVENGYNSARGSLRFWGA